MDVSPAGLFREFRKEDINRSIPDRFESIFAHSPEKTSIHSNKEQWSYEFLRSQCNRVARALVKRYGSGSEPVALLFEQGPALLNAILGVLKAGKFYVTLNTGVARRKNALILGDSGARVILTEDRCLALAQQVAESGCLVLVYEEIVDAEADQDPGIRVSPEDYAYIYYTSGSTGSPKGVVDSHRNVLHNVMRYTNSLKICAEDRLTLLQLPGFSGAVSSMFCALLNGATVFPIDPRERTAKDLGDWVLKNKLTMWHSVPTIFRLLCSDGHSYPSVRVVRLEGDRALPLDLELFRECFSANCFLVNGLGSTEAGLVRQYFMSKDMELTGSGVPLGYQVEDMEVSVGQSDGQPVGDGEIGEILVRSRYLAVGYWNDVELTKSRFLSDPGREGYRTFRTGDLGMLQPDGCLEFHGRLGSLEKVDGNTIDTSEIESVLSQVPGVKEAAVKVVAQSSGARKLVGYFVPGDFPAPTVTALRRALLKRLEPHQIPKLFVLLSAIPLSEFGKIDREALPPLSSERPDLDVPFAPPQLECERRVAGIWAQVLDLDEVGLDDNLFDLGGDSLAVSTIAAKLEIRISVLLSNPTVRQLASALESGSRKGLDISGSRMMVRIRTGSRLPPLFCLPGHNGSPVGFSKLSRYLFDGCSVYSFEFQSPVLEEAKSFKGLAERCVEEILETQPDGPYLLAGFCFGGWVAYEMASLLSKDGKVVDLLALINCHRDGWLREGGPVTRYRARVGFAMHWTRYHSGNLVRLPFGDAVAYARRRVESILAVSRESLSRSRFGSLLKLAESARYGVQNACIRLSDSFYPEPYSGRTILIQGTVPQIGWFDAPLMGWEGYLPGLIRHQIVADEQGVFGEATASAIAEAIETALNRTD